MDSNPGRKPRAFLNRHYLEKEVKEVLGTWE